MHTHAQTFEFLQYYQQSQGEDAVAGATPHHEAFDVQRNATNEVDLGGFNPLMNTEQPLGGPGLLISEMEGNESSFAVIAGLVDNGSALYSEGLRVGDILLLVDGITATGRSHREVGDVVVWSMHRVFIICLFYFGDQLFWWEQAR